MTNQETHDAGGATYKPVEPVIHIDREMYKVTVTAMTGKQLRALPSPAVGAERDLYEIRPGQDDHLVRNDETVTLRNGQRFFTAPARINPGGCD
jgi:hypothetical protein